MTSGSVRWVNSNPRKRRDDMSQKPNGTWFGPPNVGTMNTMGRFPKGRPNLSNRPTGKKPKGKGGKKK